MNKLRRFLSIILVLCFLTTFFLSPVSVETNAASITITLDPGHGGSDPGTSAAFDNGGFHYESWYNLEIAKAAKERLEKYGVIVYMTRTADTAVSLSDRVDIAVNNKSDALISIHNNSAGSSAYGSVVCAPTDNYRPAMGKKSSAIATNILEKLAKSPGTRNRGLLKESYNGLYYPDGSAADYYAINRYAKQRGLSASMIVECGFCTNTGDVALLEKETTRKQMGYSIADGIAEYYGLKLADEKPAVPKYKAEIKAADTGGKVGFNDGYTVFNLSDLTDGSIVSFNVRADSGYKCTSVTVNGKSVTVSGNGTGAASYQTKISGADITISVSFSKILYNLGVYRVTTDFLNVREQPNANDGTKILGVFNANDRFTVTEIVNTHWGKVVYNGSVGYISIHLNYAEHVSDLIIESNDIVFDNSETVKWVNDGTPDDTSISLYTDQTTEDVSLRVENNDKDKPQIDLRFDKLGSVYAEKYRYVVITAKTTDRGRASFNFYTKNSSSPIVKTLDWTGDGLWHNYLIDLSADNSWRGEIKNILIDYYSYGGNGKVLLLRNIRFFTGKPSVPEVNLSSSTMELGGSIEISYKGLGSYFGSNDNLLPFIAVYSAKSDYLGEPLFKKYLTDASGSFDFSIESTEGKIDEGNFVVRLGYDAKGTTGKSVNLHTVFYYSDLSSKTLIVEKPVRFETGLYQVYIPRVPSGVVLMRANLSDSAVVKAAIPTGTKVYVTNVAGEWGYVKYNGIDGWVNIAKNMNFVSVTDPESDVLKYPLYDVNHDYTVDASDIVAVFLYKRGGGVLSEKSMIDAGVRESKSQISILSLIAIYQQITG